MNNRVVITGMGAIAPNGVGLKNFSTALKEGKSGIRFIEELKELNFSCQVGGVPQNIEELQKDYFSQEDLLAMNENMVLSGIAGIDCWRDAGFPKISSESVATKIFAPFFFKGSKFSTTR